MDQELRLWTGGAVLTIVLAVVGTGVAVGVAVVGSVNTQIGEVRADMRDIRADIRDVQGRVRSLDDRIDGLDDRIDGLDDRIDGLDDRIDGLSDRIGAVNTTLLFLTGCIVELQDRPLLITGEARGDNSTGDPPLTARIELPQTCRTAHDRALRAE